MNNKTIAIGIEAEEYEPPSKVCNFEESNLSLRLSVLCNSGRWSVLSRERGNRRQLVVIPNFFSVFHR